MFTCQRTRKNRGFPRFLSSFADCSALAVRFIVRLGRSILAFIRCPSTLRRHFFISTAYSLVGHPAADTFRITQAFARVTGQLLAGLLGVLTVSVAGEGY
jgi:hypothetical protein